MTDTKYPDKPLQPWVPKSMRDSGVNLDEVCGEVGNASATDSMGMDKVFSPITIKEK